MCTVSVLLEQQRNRESGLKAREYMLTHLQGSIQNNKNAYVLYHKLFLCSFIYSYFTHKVNEGVCFNYFLLCYLSGLYVWFDKELRYKYVCGFVVDIHGQHTHTQKMKQVHLFWYSPFNAPPEFKKFLPIWYWKHANHCALDAKFEQSILKLGPANVLIISCCWHLFYLTSHS